MALVPIQVLVEPETKVKMDEIAKASQTNRSTVGRQLIAQGLAARETNEPKARHP